MYFPLLRFGTLCQACSERMTELGGKVIVCSTPKAVIHGTERVAKLQFYPPLRRLVVGRLFVSRDGALAFQYMWFQSPTVPLGNDHRCATNDREDTTGGTYGNQLKLPVP